MSKSSDNSRAEAHEAVRLDELVKIDAKKFGDDAEMTTEEEVICDLDEVMLVLGILHRELA